MKAFSGKNKTNSKEIVKGVTASDHLVEAIESICRKRKDCSVKKIFEDIKSLHVEFNEQNLKFLNKRDEIQKNIDKFFKDKKAQSHNVTTEEVVKYLKDIEYIAEPQQHLAVKTKGLVEEIYPMAGPQLVVPADKVNMVLNAANARWGSLYNALYGSNIINVQEDHAKKIAVVTYVNNFLDKIVTFSDGAKFSDILKFTFDPKQKELLGHLTDGRKTKIASNSQAKLVGVSPWQEEINNFYLENNRLKIEVCLDKQGKIEDVQLESAITYIIDLEDASFSAPENKYEAYRIFQGIIDGGLECEIRGDIRRVNQNSIYFDIIEGSSQKLKRSAMPLVREVGPHMYADPEIITINGEPVAEKLIDCYLTSLIGLRYHVAPKMHGFAEVEFNSRMWDRINQLQGLAANANKVGVMNEEIRLNAQLSKAIDAAKDNLFFTNTGFLDYTGSFIDLMMYQGAIAPYRLLPQQLYKSSYEVNNVNISLPAKVAQIGAGMWPKIRDMAGLLKSKEDQVKGFTDTGWSPSPPAAVIHVMAFHIFGDVRQMQQDYLTHLKPVIADHMFTFPEADIANLSQKDIEENLNFAIHGLIAYAEPWVRRGIGCSGIKDFGGELLMEDRATARIKAAFCRNWLLHKVVSQVQLEEIIKNMAKLVDSQNEDNADYQKLYNNALENNDWSQVDEVITAVRDVILNPDRIYQSYVEPYFYPANRRQQRKNKSN